MDIAEDTNVLSSEDVEVEESMLLEVEESMLLDNFAGYLKSAEEEKRWMGL